MLNTNEWETFRSVSTFQYCVCNVFLSIAGFGGLLKWSTSTCYWAIIAGFENPGFILFYYFFFVGWIANDKAYKQYENIYILYIIYVYSSTLDQTSYHIISPIHFPITKMRINENTAVNLDLYGSSPHRFVEHFIGILEIQHVVRKLILIQAEDNIGTRIEKHWRIHTCSRTQT